MNEATTITVDLPKHFYFDHFDRGLPSGAIRKELSRTVRVDLNREEYRELLNDAEYYADPDGPCTYDQGLKASARATVRRLEAVEPPPPDDWPGEEAPDPEATTVTTIRPTTIRIITTNAYGVESRSFTKAPADTVIYRGPDAVLDGTRWVCYLAPDMHVIVDAKDVTTDDAPPPPASEPEGEAPRLKYGEVGEHTLVLKDGQSIPNPTRTHHHIHGPCTLYYRVYEDGGLDIIEATEPAQPIGDGERAMFQRADDYGFDVSKIERAPDGGLWYDGSLPLDDALAQEEDAQDRGEPAAHKEEDEMTTATPEAIEIGITPRPRFIRAKYDDADQALLDELRPLADAADNYGWDGGHGYKDLPGLLEDLHNRRNVLAAAQRLMKDHTGRRSAWVVGTDTTTFPCETITEAQRVPGAQVIYFAERPCGAPVFTEVA